MHEASYSAQWQTISGPPEAVLAFTLDKPIDSTAWGCQPKRVSLCDPSLSICSFQLKL